jgi:tRNA(Arg) A34 adenosine deaminase TadA
MLTAADGRFLRQAIDLSRHAVEEMGKVPFGAVVVMDGEAIGSGINSVVELLDPSAHAEVMALRDAAKKRHSYLLPGSVLYSSSEPCPMCLAACYWARVSRIVFAAASSDAAEFGFDDLSLYRELAAMPEQRSIPEMAAGDPLRSEAAAVLKRWSDGRLGRAQPRSQSS